MAKFQVSGHKKSNKKWGQFHFHKSFKLEGFKTYWGQIFVFKNKAPYLKNFNFLG